MSSGLRRAVDMADKLREGAEGELRKLPSRQDISDAEYGRRLALAADEATWLANIVHSEVELVPVGTPRKIGREEVKALRKFAVGLDALTFSLSFSEPLCCALAGAGLDPEAMREKLDEMLGSALAAYVNAEPQKRGRPAELSRQILIGALAGAYSALTGRKPSRSEKEGGFLAFARGMFEALRIKGSLDHAVQKAFESRGRPKRKASKT
jgi:hypothetical protein